MEKVLVRLLTVSTICFARQRVFNLEAVQSSGTLHGLACAINDPLNSYGGKYDIETATCTKLSKGWLTNSTLLPSVEYFRLVQLENIFREGEVINTAIPHIFVPGGTITFYLQTTHTPLLGLLIIDFVNSEDIPLHNRIENTTYLFDSFLNNYWVTQIHTTNPFQLPNTTYILEFHFTENEVEISVDGKHFYSYSHILPVSSYGGIRVRRQEKLVCKRLLFEYQSL